MAREYKDSGIEWIGEIPVEWNVTEIKRIMRNKSVRNQPDAMVLSLYRDYGIIPKDSRDDNFNVTSDDTTNYKVVGIGDFVINKMKAWQGSMAVSEFDGIISPAYYVCSFTDKNISRKYIHYLLRNESYKPEYMRLSTGLRIGQWDLGIDDFMKIPIVIPSLDEQQRIADFLDEKCGEIDKLVSLQEQLIEELKAYKQSVITEAVTKGLNPDAPMRDSGIDWIGKIPEEWNIPRLKNVAELHGRIGWNGLRSEEFEEDSFAYLVTGQDFVSSEVCWGKCYQINETRYNEDIFIQLKNGELLITKDGTIGKIAIVSNLDKPACLNSGIFVLRQSKGVFVPKYLYWQLYSPLLMYFNRYMNLGGTTINHLYQNVFERMPLLLPSLREQESIASYLDGKCSDIDQLIDTKQSKISELKKYKKSIIFEYVTGKKYIK